MEKKKLTAIKGVVKATLSGDYIVISKSSKTGPAKEYQVNLASI
jgi:hypothetical protein